MNQLPPELQAALQHQRLLVVWGALPFELPPRLSGERAVLINKLITEAAQLPAAHIRLSVTPPLPILSLDPTDRIEREFGGRSLNVLLTRRDVPTLRVHHLLKLAGDLKSRTGLVLSREEVQHLLADEDKRYLLDQVRQITEYDSAVMLVECDPASEDFKAWWAILRPAFGPAPIFAAGDSSTVWPDEVTYLGSVQAVVNAAFANLKAPPPKMESAVSFDVPTGEKSVNTRSGGVNEALPTPEPGSPAAPMSIDVQTLRIDAAVPESVVVGRVFDLAVAVRQLISPLLAVKDLKHVESGEVQTTWEAGTPLINLRLEVDAPDCEIEGKRSIPFRLVRGKDSPLFYFRLKPMRAGDLSIVVTVYQDDYWLGSARVNTVAADQPSTLAGKVQFTVSSQPLWLDCEVRLHDRHNADFKVELTLNGEQVIEGRLPADAASFVPTGDPCEDGQRLFEILFADPELREAWGEARGRSRQRRVRLRIDPRELRGLPWELLRDDDDVLSAAAHTPFSRYLPTDQAWGGAIAARPIRVLAVISNPIDLQAKYGLPIAVFELEEMALREALGMPHPPTPSPDSNRTNQERGSGPLPSPENHILSGAERSRRTFSGEGLGVRLTFLSPPITLERLEDELRQGYHVLHFIGHGGFNTKDQQAALYLQKDDTTTQRVSDKEFAGMLKRLPHPPQLIVLAACQSATQSMQEAFSGLGPQLVKIGVPAVIAMQDNVTVLTARKFGAKFYRRLLEHGTVDLAMNEARSTLLTNGRYDAAVPVLFMRLRNGRLWGEVPAQPAPIAPASSRSASSLTSSLTKDERESLERQLQSARENLRLIEERKAEYVLGVDVPLQIVKEERRLKERLAELEKSLGLMPRV